MPEIHYRLRHTPAGVYPFAIDKWVGWFSPQGFWWFPHWTRIEGSYDHDFEQRCYRDYWRHLPQPRFPTEYLTLPSPTKD